MTALLALWFYAAGLIPTVPLVGRAYAASMAGRREMGLRPYPSLAVVAIVAWPLVLPIATAVGWLTRRPR